MSALTLLAELENRFNGPIPEPMRAAAEAGGALRVALLQAIADRAYYAQLIADQRMTIYTQELREGAHLRRLLADLKHYKREHARLDAAVADFEKQIANQGESP
jgi:hypothetical protein